jgi:RNA polymerase sigma-70 factor (ECF subfamily)
LEDSSLVRDDRDLLDRAQSCDPETLGELYAHYAPQIYAYVYRRVGDPEVAEDLTGEVFVRVVRALHAGQTWYASFRAWLYRVAHNLVVDYYRRRAPEPLLSLDETLTAAEQESIPDRVQQTLDHERLRRALTYLTPEQQEVLALRYGEGLTARQTARIVDKTVGAVEALQHRAVAALRRLLREERGDDSARWRIARRRATVKVHSVVDSPSRR